MEDDTLHDLNFRWCLEVLRGAKNVGQIARSYGVHPITVTHWKKEFLDKGTEIFGQKAALQDYERRIEELERLIGHKEVEIVLLKNFMAGSSPGKRRSSS